MNAKMLLRWSAITGFGGYGVYSLITGLLPFSPLPDGQWGMFCFFFLPLVLAYSGPFIATAYFILRRQYRHLCTLIAGLAAIIFFGTLILITERLHVTESLESLNVWGKDFPWIALALSVSIAQIVIPFYAAGWAYRRAQARLSKYGNEDTQPEGAG